MPATVLTCSPVFVQVNAFRGLAGYNDPDTFPVPFYRFSRC